MLHVILYSPEIPQNTGNIGRLCAFTNTRLHLIHPLGFATSDKYLKRAGMDYWRHLEVIEHADWEAFRQSRARPEDARIWLFTTKANKAHWEIAHRDGDGLLFGQETAGLPEHLHNWGADRRVKIPPFKSNLRSLNLATSVGIATYNALRQIHNPPAKGP